MRCDDCREAASARLDAEAPPPGVDPDAIDAHLASCADCREWLDVATSVHRRFRVRVAAPVPDRTDVLLAAVPATNRPRPVREWVRYALLAVGLTQLVLAVPVLLAAVPEHDVHMTREMGAWELAIAVGLLDAAWRPRLAPGLLPFAGALAATILVTTVLDLVGGRAVALTEASHLLDLAGVVLLWLLLVRPGRALRGRHLLAS